MSKTDKKSMSILLIIVMLFAIMNPLIVNAAEQAPEGAIEFKDQALFEALKSYNVDSNQDGYITEQEMEEKELIHITNTAPGEIKSLEDLKYAVNLESLTITNVGEEIKEFDFSSFTKLTSFNISVYVPYTDSNYKVDKENVKLPNNFVAYTEVQGSSYNIEGFSVPESIEIEVNDLYSGTSIYNLESHGKIENENIAKIYTYNNYQKYLQGVSEGTTKITYTGDLSEAQTNVTVTKSSINADHELEDNTITSRIIYDRILMSNGTLWKLNSKADVEVEDQNVSDYVYMRFSYDRDSMYLKLKEDNNLFITSYLSSIGEWGEETKVDTEIENVAQILVDNYENKLAYLTTDGNIYTLSINQDTNQIEEKLIASDVTKAEGAYYVKDGATYYMDGTLALNEEFDTAQSNAFAVGNKIYARKYFSGSIQVGLVAEDFKSFIPRFGDSIYTMYLSTNGELKYADDREIEEGTKYIDSSGLQNKVFYEINNEDILRWGELEYLTNVENFITIIIPDNDPYKQDEIFIIAVRKDGTVWTKDFHELENFQKVISPKDCPEEVQLGNIDDDDSVTIKDVKLSLQYSLGKADLSEVQIKAADVNKDGLVNIKDVKLILQYSLKIIDKF